MRKINFSRHEQVHVANIVPTAQNLQDIFSIISTKQELDHCVNQMVKQIQLSGGVNGETESLFRFLSSEMEGAENISYSIDTSGSA